MKKLLTILGLAAATLAGANAQILISQYYEGSSGANRLLEIWNHSASAINFATTNLLVKNYTNGSATASATYTLSSGTLAAGAVLVISNTDAAGDGAISTAGLTVIDTVSSAINFNGDDAIELVLGAATVDVIGQIGLDPGTAWTVGGVSTANQNIALLSNTLTIGDTNGGNAYDPSVRYTFVTNADVTSGSLSGFGVAPVPEPKTWVMIGIGSAFMLWNLRRRREIKL